MIETKPDHPPRITEIFPYPQGLETIKKYGKYHKITHIEGEIVKDDDYVEFICKKSEKK